MTRKGLLMLAMILIAAGGVFAQSARTDGDFVKQAMQTFKLDSVKPAYIEGERMGDYYRFYPAVRDGKVIGYLWWARDIHIANHTEDVLLLIGADGQKAKLLDFWVSHNDHHLNMSEDATKSKFRGMTYSRSWNDSADVITGSTISSYQYFAQFKTTLFVFENYVIKTGLLK